ncbi:thioredoxin [Encephalitozoon romaleae SJ-2008]|uniref:Thioredoxin n=1 Tax=Encephalitozoon romaleae (strain SJ-2008) TaxID=1178016 RepID=I6ZS42_ENCRO|nr:thioredoxin [Encephalitozoon romaleae SJ-2008]AFN82416.1 thioredoxin [Encephalitozoon romaleae SJ-2008]
MPIIVRDCSGMSPEEIKAKVKELGRPSLLKFSSENCGPCEDLKEKLSQYSTDLEINVFEICRTRTASYPSLWDEFDITAFPTVVLVDKDMKELQDKNGSQGALTRIVGSNIKKFEELVKEHRHLFGQNTSQ